MHAFFDQLYQSIDAHRDGSAPFSVAAHDVHVRSLARHGHHDVFGCRIAALPGVYQPHPWSSSVFLLRSLLREARPLGRVLDLGCGSGVVGLSLHHHGLASAAVLVDIDPQCVATARQNIASLGVAQHVQVRQGDLFAAVPGERFDTIVFNMPLLHLAHEGMRHLALDDTGGALAARFFGEALDYLAPGGRGYFAYSNVSQIATFAAVQDHAALRMLAAEWVPARGFGLALFEFTQHAGAQAPAGAFRRQRAAAPRSSAALPAG